jgi:hypothetical protein
VLPPQKSPAVQRAHPCCDGVRDALTNVPAAQPDGATLPASAQKPGGASVHCPAAVRLVDAVYVPAGQGNSVAEVVPVGQ